MSDFTLWLSGCRSSLDSHLGSIFLDAWPGSFADPLRYPLFSGGKRVRPALCFAAFHAIVGDGADRTVALAPAAAVELVHTYSLVHDDLPALDDDDERRGRPTVHRAFDEPTAILVGDALLTHAFAVLAAAPVSAEVRVTMVARLARAAGYRGMIGGQVADLGLGVPSFDVDTVGRLHALKTGQLLQACAALGGVVAGASADQLDALERYGRAVGLAFQLADDVLDADEDEGDDGPPSFVKLLGLDETRRRARSLAVEASKFAQALPHPERLLQLARFIVERDV